MLDAIPIIQAIQGRLDEIFRSVAEIVDLPPLDGRVNGLWISTRLYDSASASDQELDRIAGLFFLQIGFQERDRVRSINGVVIDSIAACIEALNMGAPNIRFRQPYTYTVEVERSMFEEVHMTLNVLPPQQN